MRSLADFLGVPHPATPDRPVPEPTVDLSAMTPRDFCRAFLGSQEYRQSLLNRVVLGELPPAIEQLMYHYAYGKPVEKVEVRTTTMELEHFTAEQLEERVLYLADLARQMRLEQAVDVRSDVRQAASDVRQVH